MDPIFSQLNSWKTRKVDSTLDLVKFEMKVKQDQKQKIENEQKTKQLNKEKELAKSHKMTHKEWLKKREEFKNMSIEKFEEYLTGVEKWAKQQFGKTLTEYFEWDEYLQNRTYEEFERDLYRREEDYLIDRMKFNAGIW